MTAERAYYHKLMLEVGLTDSFDRELDELLEKENPLSDLVLALSTCGGDRNEQLRILNEFIRSVPREQLDSDAVFSLVAEDFNRYYERDPDHPERIARQMHTVAESFGFDSNDRWLSLWELCHLYDEIECGAIAENDFRDALVKLLRGKDPIISF